jgi:hypothetical protein
VAMVGGLYMAWLIGYLGMSWAMQRSAGRG